MKYRKSALFCDIMPHFQLYQYVQNIKYYINEMNDDDKLKTIQYTIMGYFVESDNKFTVYILYSQLLK